MKKIIILIIVVFSVQITFCQNSLTVESITSTFFQDYKLDPIRAYENMFKNSKWVSPSSLETTKIKLKDFLTDMGEYRGYDFITEKRITENYILKSFLVKYDRQAIRFTFVLYRPNDSWTVQNFSYDTNFDEELDQSSKIDRLKINFN